MKSMVGSGWSKPGLRTMKSEDRGGALEGASVFFCKNSEIQKKITFLLVRRVWLHFSSRRRSQEGLKLVNEMELQGW